MRIKYKTGEAPGAHFYGDQSLRVDVIGERPNASEVLLQIGSQGSLTHRIPVPDDFTRLGYFIIMATELPVEIKYNDEVMVSIVEKDGDEILAQIPLTYYTTRPS